MESHILNTYHQARYRTIGHKILRSTSDSVSSESSSTQNSPEYARRPGYRRQYEDTGAGIWAATNQDWSRNQTINMSRSRDSSSDEEENIEVQEVTFSETASDNLHLSEADNVEENGLVEGDDYDIIQVYAVDPNMDFEASSDEESDEYYGNEIDKVLPNTAEYVNNYEKDPGFESQGIPSDVLNFTLDAPVVSNVDEYFIKDDNGTDILAVKDEPVVKDVDEYFIKEEKPKTINVDDFFVPSTLPEVEPHFVPKPVNINEFFVANVVNEVPETVVVPVNTKVVTNEPESEILAAAPKIEEIKNFLYSEMTYPKFKGAQRSYSLPQSPIHNICLDLDDSKTSLSFEDLNLDLSDLAFDDKEKSGNSAKIDDPPRTLTEEDVNSFLITTKPETKVESKDEDDLSHQDMDIEHPVKSIVKPLDPADLAIYIPDRLISSTPIPKPTVLDFCVEKSAAKKENANGNVKIEIEDFVDVESCNDTILPVLEAHNLNSLLEQFEATEKLNSKPKISKVIKSEEPKVKSVSLTNGTRLQDAGVQLNKNKMRQILMPSTVNAPVRRSPSPVYLDHDYCSLKKRHSLPNIKRGQSLLKPEVLSSNSRILNSRHRSCKNKKVVYHETSDDESDKCNKNKKASNNRPDETDIKDKKRSVKQTVKDIPNPTRKKLSPVHSISFKEPDDTLKGKFNNSVMVKDACKASDTPCSQNSNGSIKLTIKNKSEVILNCDDKDSQKDKPIEQCKSNSKSEKKVNIIDIKDNVKSKTIKNVKEVDSEKNKKEISSVDVRTIVNIKEEPRPKAENFYTALFGKKDLQIPQTMQVKKEKRSFEEELSIVTKMPIKCEVEQPQKKKKINIQEYKLRRGASSSNSSATVSPEAIFPDMPSPFNVDKTIKSSPSQTPPNGVANVVEHIIKDTPKPIFDPIREASRKILVHSKRHKAEATRKRDEDIVMSKIPKVESLSLQPLMSDAEVMKIVGMAQAAIVPIPVIEKLPTDYEEIVMVSIGTNTDETVFREMEKARQKLKKSQSPVDSKSLINFKIKKSDPVSKINVFDSVKRERKSPVDEKKHSEIKIDKERYKDITATLKSVGRQVDAKISSNSLFASIQDLVLKKAPDETDEIPLVHEKSSKQNSLKRNSFKRIHTAIVREYDAKAEHGEDKIITHLAKDRIRPKSSHIVIQTDADPKFPKSIAKVVTPKKCTTVRKRTDSDMSMSSGGSPVRLSKSEVPITKAKTERRELKRSQSKEKRSRSKERYDKSKRSRSPTGHKRRRSFSRSRSRDRHRRYRRSDSPYRRKYRSSYRSRRSPSVRRSYRNNSRSRATDRARSKSPISKKSSPQHSCVDRKSAKFMTPPLRKPTISESSDSSSSSSSSSSPSSSSSSGSSRVSRATSSAYRRDEYQKSFRSCSSDRESNTPVEERKIVFVGKLEKDITKSALRSQFSRFGHVLEVRLHSKEDGTRYGFVTYDCARDAWTAVESSGVFPQYDVGFGGRRAFCRQSYADLDGLKAKYTESAFHTPPLSVRRPDDISFEQMLLDMKKKLSQRKNDAKRPDDHRA